MAKSLLEQVPEIVTKTRGIGLGLVVKIFPCQWRQGESGERSGQSNPVTITLPSGSAASQNKGYDDEPQG